MPAYKSHFLKEAVESILSQSYKDFMLIVSDDCSPEPIYHIIEPFLTDDRILYRRNSHNFGAERLTEHWNMLLSMCSSEYVIFPGDDDVYESHFLQAIDLLTLSYPKIDCFRSRSQRIDSTGACFETEISFPQIQTQQDFLADFYSPGLIHCVGNNVFKRSSLLESGGFYPFPLAWFSDDVAVMLLSEKGIATTPEIHFSFRRSEMSISGNDGEYSIKRKILATCLFFRWVKGTRFFGCNQTFCKRVKAYCYNFIVWNDLTTLKFPDIIQVIRSMRSVRIGLIWLKRLYLKG